MSLPANTKKKKKEASDVYYVRLPIAFTQLFEVVAKSKEEAIRKAKTGADGAIYRGLVLNKTAKHAVAVKRRTS